MKRKAGLTKAVRAVRSCEKLYGRGGDGQTVIARRITSPEKPSGVFISAIGCSAPLRVVPGEKVPRRFREGSGS